MRLKAQENSDINPDKGKQLFFRLCAQCHSMDVTNKEHKKGPNVNELFTGRHAFVLEGKELNEDKLQDILNKHRRYLPGTKVIFAGLEKKRSDQLSLIEYLKQWIPIK